MFLELRSKSRPGIRHALSHLFLITALGGLILSIIFNSQWRYRGRQLVNMLLTFKLSKFFASFMWPPSSNSQNTELFAVSWGDHVYSHLCVNSLAILTAWNVLHLLLLFLPLRPIWNVISFGGPFWIIPNHHIPSFLFPLALAAITLNDSPTGMHASSFVVWTLLRQEKNLVPTLPVGVSMGKKMKGSFRKHWAWLDEFMKLSSVCFFMC